jgi:hypothetical protein
MRFYLKVILLLEVFTVLIALTTRMWIADPSAQPLLEAIKPDPTCTQPCWHGITIGESKFADVQSILLADHEFFSGVSRDPAPSDDEIYAGIPSAQIPVKITGSGNPKIVDEIVIDIEGQISRMTIGGAISQFGMPQWYDLKICGGGEQRWVEMEIGFKGNIEVFTDRLDQYDSQYKPLPLISITPQTLLYRIIFKPASENRNNPKWEGFRWWQRSTIPYADLGICGI